MFRQITRPSDSAEIASEAVVPDAGFVSETLDRLRAAAIPASALNNRIENLDPEQHLLDVDGLNSSLGIHLRNFEECLTGRNRLRFGNTTLADLKQFIVNLQAKQHAERRQRGLKRLSLFLERFKQFGELIGQLPDAVKIMGYIWIKSSDILQVTDSRADAFNDILEIYEQIGRNQPSKSMYTELFIKEPDLTHILSAGYRDIVEVNKWLVLYFQQRLWTEVFATTWKRHKSRLSSVISCIASRFNLVSSRASISQFDTFHNNSLFQEQQNLAEAERVDLSRRQADYLLRIRAAYPETCHWLLDDRTFKEWFDPLSITTTMPKFLWLHGKPGSGKTVLASRVVEEAKRLKSVPTVLFFYFKHDDSDRHNFLSMALTLLMQILEQHPQVLDYFYGKCCGAGGGPLTSRALIEGLLALGLKNCETVYIVLDGLDECCSRKERGEIVNWFRETIGDFPPDVREGIHCLFVSQHDSARKDFRDLPSIAVDSHNNEEDIEVFCNIRSQALVEKLRVTEQRAKEIAASVSASAGGIFLYAHLVWINLCGQSSIHSLEQEVQSFPVDLDKLDKMHARIMRTIKNKPARAECKEALMLLGWLVCAKRSLKMHEVQTMKSIDVDRRAVDFERRHFRVHPKELCESLVDVRDDGTVELVHTTARFFLTNNSFLDVVAEELHLATLCLNYLNLPSFTTPSEPAVLGGEYGFMEYAVLYWLRHIEAATTSLVSKHNEPTTSPVSKHNELFEALTEALGILVERHWNSPTATIGPIGNRTREMLAMFSQSPSYLQIQLAIVLTDKELRYFGDTRPEHSALDLARTVMRIRNRLEMVIQDYTEQDIAEDLRLKYGTHLFRCPRFSCMYFTDGFSTPDERKTHIARHERPARCTDEHCRGSRIGFATEIQLERHLKETHSDMATRQHSFPTDEEINESMREDLPEPEVESEAENEVEADFGADFETPPLPEMLPPPSVPAILPPPTRRRTKDYECTHCGKTFTKKFNWQSHLESHGGNKSYSCPVCFKTCARHGTLVRHMKLHDPESAVTCGGVLSNGRRWGCQTSFARADILREHHKSKKGMRCIAQRDSEDQAGPSQP
ncbi:hypothetical protein GQ44DRAFT_627937 [Phaeosphaeriaceae sp. PMI808]|nr:hypothetical protein GQ44DRAFT_627937 [Phaeosphaeriaceae sp. PMI808]